MQNVFENQKKSQKLCSVFMFFVQTYYTWYIQITLCELYICFLLYFMLATFFSYSCCYETRQINICVYTQFFSTISLSLSHSLCHSIHFIIIFSQTKAQKKLSTHRSRWLWWPSMCECMVFSYMMPFVRDFFFVLFSLLLQHIHYIKTRIEKVK